MGGVPSVMQITKTGFDIVILLAWEMTMGCSTLRSRAVPRGVVPAHSVWWVYTQRNI